MQVHVARAPQQQHTPAFVVQKLAGTRTKPIVSKNPETNQLETKIATVDAGYLVKFPKGHSIRCEDLDHLNRLGFGPNNTVPLVDNYGDVVGTANNVIETRSMEDMISESAGLDPDDDEEVQGKK